VKYSDDYKHFDNLIWQVPAWSEAIFIGILVGANEILNNYSPTWGVDQNIFLFLVLLSGCIFLFSSSYILYRFRHNQSTVVSTVVKDKVPFAKRLGAQTILQFSLTYQLTVCIVLSLYTIFRSFLLSSVIGVLAIVVMTIYYEFNLSKIKKSGEGDHVA
jgi:glucose-6-phosphate-specific signal transduction histidine kinase